MTAHSVPAAQPKPIKSHSEHPALIATTAFSDTTNKHMVYERIRQMTSAKHGFVNVLPSRPVDNLVSSYLTKAMVYTNTRL